MTDDLLSEVVWVATGEIGVTETSHNRSPRIDQYVLSVGLSPAAEHPWCGCFSYWAFAVAAANLDVVNPCVRTASALKHYIGAPQANRRQLPNVRPGCLVVFNHGMGTGHVGIVDGIDFTTRTFTHVSGNTNAEGSREGNCVARHTVSFDEPKLFGFVDWGAGVGSEVGT